MIEKLEQLKIHPYYKNYFKKLKADDLSYMFSFIRELENLDKDQRILAVYRSAIREDKPKGWKIVEELLSIAIKQEK